ncbi:hypothetical protein Q3G72_013342 [Acer saccharum]|nr:hypothetical protein Q3G72_013342 [Acer saccharum]
MYFGKDRMEYLSKLAAVAGHCPWHEPADTPQPSSRDHSFWAAGLLQRHEAADLPRDLVLSVPRVLSRGNESTVIILAHQRLLFSMPFLAPAQHNYYNQNHMQLLDT